MRTIISEYKDETVNELIAMLHLSIGSAMWKGDENQNWKKEQMYQILTPKIKVTFKGISIVSPEHEGPLVRIVLNYSNLSLKHILWLVVLFG